MSQSKKKNVPCSASPAFSLVELLMVVVILMIVAGYAIPTSMTVIANVRLRGAASDFAGLVQRARISSVQKNAVYTVLFNLPSGRGAYVDWNGSGTYTTGEPMIQFGGNVQQVAAPAGAAGKPSNLDAAGGPLGWTATPGNISFNARGLPCNATATPCGTSVNYIFYFSDTRYNGSSGWTAVSITAAARSKVWVWTGSSWGN